MSYAVVLPKIQLESIEHGVEHQVLGLFDIPYHRVNGHSYDCRRINTTTRARSMVPSVHYI
jgi:hypothetical protein